MPAPSKQSESASGSQAIVNVAARLSNIASVRSNEIAVAMPGRRDREGKRTYSSVTFAELEQDTNRIASGLIAAGARPGMRLVLLVRPSIDFIALVFAMLKAGVVMVLIDPGMGRRNLVRCLTESQPEGFVAISPVHAVRTLLAGRFKQAKFNITVGRRWFWGGWTLEQIRELGSEDTYSAATIANDPAAIIFTTGSTGPPKGVLYHHEIFDQQVQQIRDQYDIQPGEIDLPGFPLFGLFNAAMGVTTVIPDMDFTRPARVDPRNIIEAVRDWNVTQSFGSPALWNAVGHYCAENDVRLPTLRRVLSAGAPVPPRVLRWMRAVISDDGEMHTPYGATEALPVATISATEVIGSPNWEGEAPAEPSKLGRSLALPKGLALPGTSVLSDEGAGTCVGRRFSGIEWRVIRISDEPIGSIDQTEELPSGEIGELIVRGPVVTKQYVTRTEANAEHRIADGDTFWHRMGDVGYLDDDDRFWFCGRRAHRVVTSGGTLFSVPCEAIFNRHAAVYRSALVGVETSVVVRSAIHVADRGAISDYRDQAPIILIELEAASRRKSAKELAQLRDELLAIAKSYETTTAIEHLMFHPGFPVDIRHNAKIFREKLAVWAQRRLSKRSDKSPDLSHDST